MPQQKALEIGTAQPAVNFLLSHSIACNNYVAARSVLNANLFISGCLLAQQFSEICAKAILRVYWKELEGKHNGQAERIISGYRHNVARLLKEEVDLVPDFDKVNTDSELIEFLGALSEVYLYGRFGEKPVNGNGGEVIRLLDRLARVLLDTHAKAINYPSTPKLYVEPHLKEKFLENNLNFSETDITTNPMASIFPLPEIE